MKASDPIAKAMRREDWPITGRGGAYRYFIQFSAKPYIPGERHVWPRLFDTRREAEDWMHSAGDVLFKQNIPGRRISSAAVQSVRAK